MLGALRPGDLSDANGRHGALTMVAGDGPGVPEGNGKRVIYIDESWSGNKPTGATGDHYSVVFDGT